VDLIIPTYGRASSQPTLAQLVSAGLHVTLVVQEREALSYGGFKSDQVDVYVLPDSIRTIAPTRQHILHHVGRSPAFCMIDDDLWFYKRRDDDRTKLREIAAMELDKAFAVMNDVIITGHTAHVGFASREGANRNTATMAFNTRIMRVLGYDRQKVQMLDAKFSDMEVMEDFHIALSLLECGEQNVILNDYAHNQASGSGAHGGCSHFRTPELHAANAHRLAELHPGYVKVVKKATKGAWGGGERTDVNVQWKKAYASSQN
jgi:hypothetical protein